MFDKQKFSEIFKSIYNKYDNQRDFASATGVNRAYISQYMNMKLENPPTPKILKKIADNSKEVTTYDELMEVCGYKEESIELYTYNTYDNLKKFNNYINEKENLNDDYLITSTVDTILDYLSRLKDRILNKSNEKIFLFDFFKLSEKIEMYAFISAFMMIHDSFVKLLEKKDVIEFKNYNFIDWSNIEIIYLNISNIYNFELFSYSNINFLIKNKNSNNLLLEYINDFSNFFNITFLSNVDSNALTEFFKYKINLEKNSTIDAQISVEVSDDYIENTNRTRIPVLGSIPAGIPIEMIEDVVDYEDISEDMLKGGKQYFALKIKGDSMFPEYLNGDVIIVLKQDDCESGQDAVVAVNGNNATFKRVFKTDNGITLQPLNNQYMPTFYSNEDIVNKPIKILGIVKQIRRDKN